MLRHALIAAVVLLAVVYYYLLGYGPVAAEIYDEFEWWRPRGWIHQSPAFSSLSDMARTSDSGRWIPVLLFAQPAVLAILATFALYRGALARTFVTFLGLLMIAMAYYGILADRVWRFFEWRFILVAASVVLVVTGSAFAPSLLRSLGRLPWLARFGLLLAVGALVFAVSTEVTGTNSDMAFNVSPWPVVTVFGMLGAGLVLAALHLSAGAGVLARSLIGGGSTSATLAGLAVALVCGALAAFIPLSDPLEPLFGAGPAASGAAAIAIAGTLYAALVMGFTRADEQVASAANRLAAGALLFAVIAGSDAIARDFQRTARDETAQNVLVALERYKESHGSYPDDLETLVPDYFESVPRPRIGLRLDFDDEFNYSKYSSDQYALEFASVQWVQCAYSPPYAFADDVEPEAAYDDEEADETGAGEELWEQWADNADVASAPSSDRLAQRERLREAGLAGEGSCSTEPPKLW